MLDDLVTVDLTDPSGLVLEETIMTNDGGKTVHSINTGVPHTVLYVSDADKAMVESLGAEIRNHGHFSPSGTNVNFVQVLEDGHIHVRTYERGVGETLACGTGVSASAIISGLINDWPSPVKVDVLGGDQLEVNFIRNGKNFTAVQLTGRAEIVYHGEIVV